jgi:hypothetical protein
MLLTISRLPNKLKDTRKTPLLAANKLNFRDKIDRNNFNRGALLCAVIANLHGWLAYDRDEKNEFVKVMFKVAETIIEYLTSRDAGKSVEEVAIITVLSA